MRTVNRLSPQFVRKGSIPPGVYADGVHAIREGRNIRYIALPPSLRDVSTGVAVLTARARPD